MANWLKAQSLQNEPDDESGQARSRGSESHGPRFYGDGYVPSRPVSDRERERLNAQHKDWLTFIALCAFGGAVLGVVLVALAVRFDLNGIGSMIARSDHWIGYTLLFAASMASTFSALTMGIGIMIRASLPRG